MNSVVEAKKLIKRYENLLALDEVSLDVLRAECLVILGPNGAGKTTLMEILEGIKKPCSGDVRILGLPPTDIECKRIIGVQNESGVFESELKVFEILELYRSFYAKGLDFDYLLDKLGLSEKKQSFFGQLSKGMKQKVSVAVALVNDPEIVFLDEPTSGLDIESRKDIWDFIQDLKKLGKTIIMTTHDIQEAGALADKIMVISKGCVKITGLLTDIIMNFPVKKKIEYFGEQLDSVDVARKICIANKQVVYSDETDFLVKEIQASGGLNIIVSDINLEDVYLFYQKGIK